MRIGIMDLMPQQSIWAVHLRPVGGIIPQGPIDYKKRVEDMESRFILHIFIEGGCGDK